MELHRELINSQDSAGHGRLEERRALVFRRSDNPELFDHWLPAAAPFLDIESVVRIDFTRTDRATGKSSHETRYYVSSRKLTARAANEAVRKHWRLENQLHWVLDMTFGADQCRIRTKNAAANFACARQIALCLLRMHTRDRMSMSARRELCRDWPQYLAWVLDSI
jgi:predicted transposase YbfD/YdcC